MKKLILLLIFMQLGAAVSKAQDLYKNMNAPYTKEYRICYRN